MQSDEAFGYIQKSFKEGRLAHAYIIAGDPKGNALEFSERMSKMLLCRKDSNGSGCGKCPDCANIDAHTHSDVMWIHPSGAARQIKVDDIREIVIPWAAKSSFEGGWKILNISAAECFNDSSANAFLKTLEEPPPKTLILLLTGHAERMLPTIISRCQKIDLNEGRTPAGRDIRARIGEILSKHSTATEVQCFASAAGIIGIFEEFEKRAEKEVKSEQKDEETEDNEDVTKARIKTKVREWQNDVLLAMQDWYRDLMALASGDGKTLFYEEYRSVLSARAAKTPVRKSVEYVSFIDRIAVQLTARNMSASIVFPYWMGRLG